MADLDQAVEAQSAVKTNVIASVGAILLAARQAKNLSQQDVSNSLRYSIKQIEALENDAFDLLPDAMITRGFIRNYAKLLELDAAPLLEIFRSAVPATSPVGLSVSGSMSPVQLTKESLPWLKYILSSILILLFLLAWFFYVDYMPENLSSSAVSSPQQHDVAQQPDNSAAEVPASVEMSLPEIALPAAERQPEDVAPVAADAASASVDVEKSESSAIAVQSMQPTTEVQPKSQGEKKISMSSTEETWVRVTDNAGKVLYEKMLSAGGAEELNILPPCHIVIGNAKATTLNYAGQVIDFSAVTKNNVARITLE